MESWVALLAQAGIQDLYLETFYHGLATNNSSVYNDRFAFDYLADAIKAAAKYSVRVHAWCETGYQGFGSSGNYLLNANHATNGDQNGRAGNPEWRVLNIADPTIFGDGTAGQMFVNLMHPGVQARLAEYVAELAAYPGLAGIHIDYHRYPLDNNTGDSFPAPWSYDSWTRAAFQAAGFGDPVNTAAGSTGPNSSQWSQFVAFRRAGIGECVGAMSGAVASVEPGLQWSGAVFAFPYNSAQLTKMQDWPAWCSAGNLGIAIPMCYSSTSSSIRNELNSALSLAGPVRVVAGLAVVPVGASHPAAPTQLTAVLTASTRMEDFVFFDASYFVDATSGATRRTDLKTWLTNNATPQRGDINADGWIDARDLVLFSTLYTGTPIPRNASNFRYDLNDDNVINGADFTLLRQAFARFKFGEDGVVNARDLQALINCLGHSGPPPAAGQPGHLYDLDGDGDVDYQDQLALQGLLTVAVGPDLDVNRNGVVDVNDLYVQALGPIDVDRNGVINAADLRTLMDALRANEAIDMSAGRG